MITREEAIRLFDGDWEKAIATVIALSAEVDELKARLRQKSLSPPAVSPTTPSGQTPVYLKAVTRRRRRKPGRKRGHRGAGRQRPERIDRTEVHPLETCPHCQTDLSKRDVVRTRARFIEDLPPIVTAEVTEHHIGGKWCPTCKKIVDPQVTDALPGARIGLRLMVLSAFLHYGIGVSVSNTVRLVRVFCGVKLTPGALPQMWARLAGILRPEYDRIGQQARESAVLNADETGWRENGRTLWLWAFAGKDFCYYHIDPSRSSKVLKKFFGKFFHGILCADFWGAYNKLLALAKQRCYFHLFTELEKVDDKNTSLAWKRWCKKLSRLLWDAIRLWERHESLSKTTYERRKNRLARRLAAFLAADSPDADAQRLLKRLRRHRNELLTFLDHPDTVTPYNDLGERSMRPAVLQRKVCQQNRSLRGRETQAIFLTLLRTHHLKGLNPIEETLRQLRLQVFELRTSEQSKAG